MRWGAALAQTGQGTDGFANAPAPSGGSPSGGAGNSAGGTRVNLNLNLNFVSANGDPVSPDLAISLTRGAQAEWTGAFGSYNATAGFSNPAAPTVTVTCFSGAGVSNTNGVGGNNINLYLGGYKAANGAITPESPATLVKVFSHEVGHALGAKDQYTSTGTPNRGHANDLMGSVNPKATPRASTIREIILFNGATP